MEEYIKDALIKKLIEFVSDADMPKARRNISLDLIQSEPMENDVCWWMIRIRIIANDMDKIGFDMSMGERLAWRVN